MSEDKAANDGVCWFRRDKSDSHLCHQTGLPIGYPCTGECVSGGMPFALVRKAKP